MQRFLKRKFNSKSIWFRILETIRGPSVLGKIASKIYKQQNSKVLSNYTVKRLVYYYNNIYIKMIFSFITYKIYHTTALPKSNSLICSGNIFF